MGESNPSDVRGERRLRHTVLDKGAVFGAGLVVATTTGLVIGVLTSAAVATAIGYALLLFGVVWLFAGGMSGGGFSVLGVGRGAGRYTYAVGDGNEPLLAELRHGYRPAADPVAFWLVVGGVLYVAIGIVVITTGS